MAWIFVNQEKFYLHDNETLLEGLLRQGYMPAYQCGEGYCGTCKLKRHPNDPFTAQVDLVHKPITILATDEILPCSSHIKGVLHIQLEPLSAKQHQNLNHEHDDLDDLYDDKIFKP